MIDVVVFEPEGQDNNNNIILVITYTILHALHRLLTYFRFSAGPTDERYVTGEGVRASVTLCDRGRGVKIGQKKRYVIVERPQ